jgi:hypothetical protein
MFVFVCVISSFAYKETANFTERKSVKRISGQGKNELTYREFTQIWEPVGAGKAGS